MDAVDNVQIVYFQLQGQSDAWKPVQSRERQIGNQSEHACAYACTYAIRAVHTEESSQGGTPHRW